MEWFRKAPRWLRRILYRVGYFRTDRLLAGDINAYRSELGLHHPVRHIMRDYWMSPSRCWHCFLNGTAQSSRTGRRNAGHTLPALRRKRSGSRVREPRGFLGCRRRAGVVHAGLGEPAGALVLRRGARSLPAAQFPGPVRDALSGAASFRAPTRYPTRRVRAFRPGLAALQGAGPSRRHRHGRPGAGGRGAAVRDGHESRPARQRVPSGPPGRGGVRLPEGLHGRPGGRRAGAPDVVPGSGSGVSACRARIAEQMPAEAVFRLLEEAHRTACG